MADENNESETVAEIKTSEYVKDLLKEKSGLHPDDYPNAMRLLDDEISKAQAVAQTGKIFRPEARYVDIYKEKPVKVSTKVLVPVKEHPKFNFVGKLLGPKGNSLKRIQEETLTKMAILGRGSMRDKTKEDELRNSQDPKYAHLSDELHVEITALSSPAEAYARIAFALAEIRKFLIPDVHDEIRQEQLREIQQFGNVRGGRGGGPGAPGRGATRAPVGRGGPRNVIPPGRGGHLGGPPMGGPRGGGKSKVLSILDRARAAMEDNYNAPPSYEEPGYYDNAPQPPMNYDGAGGPGSAYNGSGYYEGGGYGNGPVAGGPVESAGGWKAYGPPGVGDSSVGKAPPPGANRFGGARPAPYARPGK